MKIHDVLLTSVEDKIHRILTFQEIKDLVLARFPEIKPTSILPSEHAQQHRSTCLQCKTAPIFKKIGRGFYEVLPQARATAPEKTVHEKLALALADAAGKELGMAEIRARVAAVFPETHLPSVIPSDHIKGGSCKLCSQAPLLQRSAVRGRYKVLGTLNTAAAGLYLKEEASSGDSEISLKLAALLENHGVEMLYTQAELFIQRLAEPLTGNRLLFNLLSLGVRERIPIDLLEYSELLPEGALLAKLARRLRENYGVETMLAARSVAIWAQALKRLTQESFVYSPSAPRQRLGGQGPEQSDGPAGSLHTLTLRSTATGYQVLKKSTRNVAVALWVSHANGYALGIKKEHLLPSLAALLQAHATADGFCPPELIPSFSPRRAGDWPHRTYVWFTRVPRELLEQVFLDLDAKF